MLYTLLPPCITLTKYRHGMFCTNGSQKKEQLPGDNSVRRGLFRVQKLDIFQSLGRFDVT